MIKKKKLFYGWWIVIVSSVLNLISSGAWYYGFTIFFNPIRNAFGWTAAVTSIAFTLRGIETGALGPVAGLVVDRMGPRKLMLFGWGITGIGFFWMSRINSLWSFYGSFLLVATGLSFGTGLVTSTAVANWFSRMRSRAITLNNVGVGIGGLLVPLLAASITLFGWRDTLVFLGIASWIVGIPLSLLMRRRPEEYGYLPDGDTATSIGAENEVVDSQTIDLPVKAIIKTRAFWILSLVLLFQSFATGAISVHIVPFLESVNVSTPVAAATVTGMTLCTIIGRVGFGFLGDFHDKRYLIAIATVLQTIGIFIFSLIDEGRTWLIIPFLFTYAPGFAGPIPLRPALQADYFGTKNFGTTLGVMSLIGTVGGLSSPVIAGWFFDVTGSYNLAWRLFALSSIPGIPLILLVKLPQPHHEYKTIPSALH